ncbi:MAG: 4-hydroxy-tetrahydrodipicolinate synthase [Clostridiales bacterium]
MKQPPFLGSCVALVTPFTDDGVDYEELEELIEWHLREGSNAILIGGTTGEASTMTKEEHKSIIRFTVEKVAKRIPVMAGTGSNNTQYTIEMSQYAQSVGADCLLLVTPYYNKTTQEGLYQHFKAVAEAVTIPIVLYNVPARTNLNINPETLKRLSAIENIVALKECNLNQVAQTRLLCSDDLAIYSGEDGNVLPLLALGGLGVISVMANIVPADTSRMVTAFFNGDLDTSRSLQIRAINLVNALFCEINPIPIKAAMNQMGFHVGKCRLPLVEISGNGRNTVCTALKEYGLI